MINQFEDEFETRYDSEKREYLYCYECKIMIANSVAIDLGSSKLKKLHKEIHQEDNLKSPGYQK